MIKTLSEKFNEIEIGVIKNSAKMICNAAKSMGLKNISNSFGAEQAITTLTYIAKEVSEQKFYQVTPSEYIPVKAGSGAFMTNILNWTSFDLSDDFETGYTGQATNGSGIPLVDTALDKVTTPIENWNKAIEYSILQLNQYNQGNQILDLVSQKEKSRKKNYDLGIQKTVFLGSQSKGWKGLVNLPCNVNSSLMTTQISKMSADQLNAFAAGLIAVFRQNNNFTAYPDILAIPETDYNGLGSASSSQFPLMSKIEFLEKAFSMITMKPFKIKPLSYLIAANSSGVLARDRYMLYCKDEDSLVYNVPVPYTSTQAQSFDGYTFRNIGYAQVSPVTLIKPLEVLYLEIAGQ